jgi:hypothetical protein
MERVQERAIGERRKASHAQVYADHRLRWVPCGLHLHLGLTERGGRGEQIDSKTIKKHKNDVFRLYQILDPASNPVAPKVVKNDIREFISRMRSEDVDLKSLGLRTGTRDGILEEIASVYRVSGGE